MTPLESALYELLSSLAKAPDLRRRLETDSWFVDLAERTDNRPLDVRLLVRRVVEGDKVAELLARTAATLPDRSVEIRAMAERFSISFRSIEGQVRESRRVWEERNPIRILHLSDLHFSATSAWNQDPVLTSLVFEVKALREQLGPIHRVVITGDIANFGTAKEYAKAAKWLHGPLVEAAEVKANQIRMVPGNHDVERSKVNLAVSGLDEKVLSQGDATIAMLMSDKAQRKMLLDRQAAYRKFAKGFNPQDDGPGWRSEEEIEGWFVHFIGLNTAWLSGSHKLAGGTVHDHRNLALGGWQWNALFPADHSVADVTIALMHHPWEDLTEHDSRAHQEATYDRCGVILRGHLHRVETLSAERDGRLVLEAAAGACYADPRDNWPHGFQLLELHPGAGLARVHLRKWHSDTKRWIPDRERYPNMGANGLIEQELRRSHRAPRPPPPDDEPSKKVIDTPVRTSRERYAALLRGQLDKLPDVFRVGGGPRTIEAVYVEVTLAAHERELDDGADALNAQGREVARRFIGGADDLHGRVPLTRVLAHHHRRWGLLGEPGGGKTTLLRHVAIELLKDMTGPLPIYLKVAELEQGLYKAIEALCASFDDAILATFVFGEAQAGRAVLLIDGLDEAVDLTAAHNWVVGAAAKVGVSQVIIASRPIGYTEPSSDFHTLTLCPLGADEQTELLTRWVSNRAIVHDALERLSRTPRLRRLAENPLLLTLIGLLLRAGKDVPSRRGDLYERALKLLLTRDHNAEDAAPIAPMREPDLTLELLGWAALSLHGLEDEAYRRDALVTALQADPRNAARLSKHWSNPATFIAEVAERTGLLIPDTGRVKDATAYSFPHRTFREFLAATALERDMGAVAAGVASGVGELSRVFVEGKARPERWSEVLALTCGRLGPGGADALVRRITQEGNKALLLRVVADAEGLSAETVRGTLKMEAGWQERQLQARQKVIEEIPALVKDLAVAVGLLEQIAKSTTCGHDLFWVREVLRHIERGQVEGDVLGGSVDDAKRAAKSAADNVLSHLNSQNRSVLMALLKPMWRQIPAGSFDMGDERIGDAEKPIHSVTLTSGFQMLNVPVTWAMYGLFDPGHDAAREHFGGKLPTESQNEVPAYKVSWYAAVMFAEWAGARLPLEPEWEYACRAGTTTRYWSGDSTGDLSNVGWHDRNSKSQPHPVAQKPENAWGLHDVHGNVWEWCTDAWDSKAYAHRARGLIVDPRRLTYIVRNGQHESATSADRGALRVVRGGSFLNRPASSCSALRASYSPSYSANHLGFRLVLPTSEQA
jgi:formylglycine-generating enzyme required for sulfatase activity/predicted phosphodiesterase